MLTLSFEGMEFRSHSTATMNPGVEQLPGMCEPHSSFSLFLLAVFLNTTVDGNLQLEPQDLRGNKLRVPPASEWFVAPILLSCTTMQVNVLSGDEWRNIKHHFPPVREYHR